MTNDPRSCKECQFCIFQDYGYSNWTWEGTTVHCAKGLHPSGEDGFELIDDDPQLGFAARCVGFDPGDPIWMDVEGEAIEELRLEPKQIYEMWASKGND